MKVVDDIRRHGLRQPAHPAVIAQGPSGRLETLDYAALVAAMDRRAQAFREAGARPGERVGLMARQGVGFIEAALGMLAADLCMVPIPDDTGPQALDRFAVQARLHHLATEADGFALRTFTDVVAPDAQGERAFRELGPAYLRFTSGTTYERKGVIIGQQRIDERLRAANRGLGIGPDDRVMWLLPMAHHFVVSILLYLRYGATILLPGSSLARPVLELADASVASMIYASPYHYSLLAKDASELRLDSVRLAISTATGLREETARLFFTRFGRPIVQALGIIEVGLPVINLAHAEGKPTSLGQPLPDYSVWLRGEDGHAVDATSGSGAVRGGEVCIRGPGLFDAYLDPWSSAEELTRRDGFRTGDEGFFDADGDLHLIGRRQNRISMAGMKFFAEEVEDVLDSHPEVTASRVYAQQHAQLGDLPVAEIVVRDPDAPPATRELNQYCRVHLPSYKIPRRYEIVEALPLTETGKVRRWSGRRDPSVPEKAE